MNKLRIKWLGLTLIGVMVGSVACADVIMVVDADNSNAGAAYDLSTGLDSTVGLTGSYSSSGTPAWPDTSVPDEYWGGTSAGFLNGGTVETATWTVSGFTVGQQVETFVHWRELGQVANNSTDASYSVNGGTAVLGNQKLQVPGDLVLNDGSVDLSFFSLGTYIADGGGNVSIVMTAGSEFTAVDSAAFMAIPEPATFGMVALFGGGILFIRRKLMI